MDLRSFKKLGAVIAVLFFLYFIGLGAVLTGIAQTFIKGWKSNGNNPTYSVTLDYSTYLGGSGDDRGEDIDVVQGYAYVTGYTASLDFPTAGAYQEGYGGGSYDAFVTKFSTSGSDIIFSTYLGGSGADYGKGIDYYYDPFGTSYVFLAGYTTSPDFPTIAAYQAGFAGGGEDAFICKISSTGSVLIYSTYLGGGGIDRATAVEASEERPYVTGYTASDNFPTYHSYQSSWNGGTDAFIVKLSTFGLLSGSGTYSTYLGGDGDDYSYALTIYPVGYSFTACVTGKTDSGNFPTANSYQASLAGGSDAFVTRLQSMGSSLATSTYLGGSGDDSGESVAVGADRGITVAGYTSSGDFPTENAYQSGRGGTGVDHDIFVTRFDPVNQQYSPDEDLASLYYSTYLGGDGNDYGYAVMLDDESSVGITGQTFSADFPTNNSYQAGYGGSADALLARFSYTGSQLLFSTYLGGSNEERGAGIAPGNSGKIYLAGQTQSSDFPTANPYQAGHAGNRDGFVTKINWEFVPSLTPTPLATRTPTPTLTPTPTSTPSMTPTPTPTPTSTATPIPSPTPTVVVYFNVRGRVTHQISDAPIAGASLMAVVGNRKSDVGVSNGSGFYTLFPRSHLPSSTVTVKGRCPGYLPNTISRSYTDWNDVTGVDLELMPANIDRLIASSDYDGDGTPDIAVFRSSGSLWAVRGVTRVYYGSSGDELAPADYNGDGTTSVGIFRPATSLWAIRDFTRIYFGDFADIPLPGDFNGDGTYEAAVFRGYNNLWAARGVTTVYFGSQDDQPIPGDYDGDGAPDIAVFRSSNVLWALRGVSRVYFGNAPDMLVPADYNGDGTAVPAVFRPSTSLWAIRNLSKLYFGAAADQPLPADFNGDGTGDVMIFRGAGHLWKVRELSSNYFGNTGDVPLTR